MALILPILIAVSAFGCVPAATAPTDLSAAASSDFQSVLDQWASTPGHQGVTASVVLANGSQWTGAAGRAGASEAMRPEHLIAIASITKTMTAAVALQLADESRLSLDDPIARWTDTRPHFDPAITLRQLMNHTNGLDNYTGTAALSSAISADPSHVFSPDELLSFVGPPHFARGSGTEYTNTSFVLLGQILERVTGRSVVSLWRDRLWSPLRLTGVFLPGADGPPAPVAQALTSQGLIAPLDRMASLTAGSTAFGLMASAKDIAAWGNALYAGSVISGRMQQEMRTVVPAAGNIPGESGSGLGLRSYSYLGRNQIGHSGRSPFGSSLLLHDTASRVTVAVLINQGAGADHFSLAPALLQVALQK